MLLRSRLVVSHRPLSSFLASPFPRWTPINQGQETISGEDGFTLTELLIVIAILGMVAAAVVGVSQVSQQTYTRAASLEDAQLGARAGLDRMATELRLIGAYWSGATDATDAITR